MRKLNILAFFFLIFTLIISVYLIISSSDCILFQSCIIEECRSGVLPYLLTIYISNFQYILSSIVCIMLIHYVYICRDIIGFRGWTDHLYRVIVVPSHRIVEQKVWFISIISIIKCWFTGSLLKVWWISMLITINIILMNVATSILARVNLYPSHSTFKITLYFKTLMICCFLFHVTLIYYDAILLIFNLLGDRFIIDIKKEIFVIISSLIFLYYRFFHCNFYYQKFHFPSSNVLITSFEKC